MPVYATESDLDTLFGAEEITRLADHDRDGVRDAGVIDAALDFAHVRAHSILGHRIQNLLTQPEQLAGLKYPVADLARWFLYGTRSTDEVQARADAALKHLKDVREGAEDLGISGSDLTNAADLDSTIQMQPGGERWGGGAY
jgi:phage gp36-like protein